MYQHTNPSGLPRRTAALIVGAVLGLAAAAAVIPAVAATDGPYPPPDCVETRTCQTPEEIYLAGLRTEFVDGELQPGGDYTDVPDDDLLDMGRALCGTIPNGSNDPTLDMTEQAIWATDNDVDPALVGAASRLCN